MNGTTVRRSQKVTYVRHYKNVLSLKGEDYKDKQAVVSVETLSLVFISGHIVLNADGSIYEVTGKVGGV